MEHVRSSGPQRLSGWRAYVANRRVDHSHQVSISNLASVVSIVSLRQPSHRGWPLLPPQRSERLASSSGRSAYYGAPFHWSFTNFRMILPHKLSYRRNFLLFFFRAAHILSHIHSAVYVMSQWPAVCLSIYVYSKAISKQFSRWPKKSKMSFNNFLNYLSPYLEKN